MLKHWRVWLLLITVLGAMLAIGLKTYPYGRTGVEIVYISETSPAKDVLEQGMIVTHINGRAIKNSDDWQSAVINLTGPVTLRANRKDYSFVVNESLGIDVMDIERTNLDFGLDLKGGTSIILKPKENATKDMVDQIIATLQTRANIYGLREMKFYPIGGPDGWYVQIEAAGIGADIIDELLSRQGRFEAKILKPVKISNGIASLRLISQTFQIEVQNESIIFKGEAVRPNETFTAGGIEFEYVNKTADTLFLLGTAYTGEDIELVYTDPQHSGIVPRQNVYQFYFAVLISDKGAKRFADITYGIPSHLDIASGEEYLDSQIFLFIDEQLVSALRIAADLGGQYVQTPSIQGTRASREEAIEEKLQLQTILRSGALPTTLEKVSIDIVSPTLGKGFFISAGWAVLLAAAIVVVIVVLRYRSFRIALPMILIGLSEVVIILGIAAMSDAGIWSGVLIINVCLIGLAWWKKYETDLYAWIGAVLIPLLGMMSWTIDLPAIGGIIAAIGTGVDHQIIIADETIRGEEKERRTYTVKEKIKRAFFIIFGAAATTIAAMVPLMFLGIGLVRGFAITTVVGVLVGILITRPAYARIIESLIKK